MKKLLDYLAERAKAETDMAGHLLFLYQLVVYANLRRIVELGTRGGESTLALLIGAARMDGHVTSVDHGKGSPYAAEPPTREFLKEAERMIREDLDLGRFWTLVIRDDLEYAAEYDDEIDLLLVDTVHSYDQTRKELEAWGKKVVDGGFILVHDTVSYPEQNKAIWEYLDNNPASILVEHSESNGLGIILKDSGNIAEIPSIGSVLKARLDRLQRGTISLRQSLRAEIERERNIREEYEKVIQEHDKAMQFLREENQKFKMIIKSRDEAISYLKDEILDLQKEVTRLQSATYFTKMLAKLFKRK